MGRPAARIDAEAKVRGTALYGDDYQPAGGLHLRIVRSPHASAEILGVDPAPALAVSGVVGVLTAADVPGRNAYGIIVEDQRLMDFDCSTVSLTLTQWRLVVFLHEFMHVLGAAHEENAADGGAPDPIIDPTGVDICNGYNIMVGGGYCGGSAVVIPQEVYGTGNDDRRFGATEAIAGPRCSIECTAQFDFSYLLSVRTSNNMDRLDDVV